MRACCRTAAAGGCPNVQPPGGSLWPRTHECPRGSRTLLRTLGWSDPSALGAGELAGHGVTLACLAYTRSAHSFSNAPSRDCSGPPMSAFTVSRGLEPAAAPCLLSHTASVSPALSAGLQAPGRCWPCRQSRFPLHIHSLFYGCGPPAVWQDHAREPSGSACRSSAPRLLLQHNCATTERELPGRPRMQACDFQGASKPAASTPARWPVRS